MVDVRPRSAEVSSSAARLVRSLRQVGTDLRMLEIRARRAEGSGELSRLDFCPKQIGRLRLILSEGRTAVVRRAGELGEALSEHNAGEGADVSPSIEAGDPTAFLAAYRACCRRVCGALREAIDNRDSLTGAMLSGLVLKLEKQLWLIDTARNRGADDWRSVSLFLAC
jgi:hypothetical protein